MAVAEAHSDGLRINYSDSGQGEPALLFLPGWACDHTQVDPTAQLSAEHRRVVVLDWRGHGRSESSSADFGYKEMVEDALSVIEASGAQQVVPVAQAHAGWVAIEMRRRLGERTPKLVLTSFLVLDPPPPFLAAMEAAQDPARWQEARESVFATWLEGVTHPDVVRFVREVMGSYGFEMWAQAGRSPELTLGTARRSRHWPSSTRPCPRSTSTASRPTQATWPRRRASRRSTPGSRCVDSRCTATSRRSRRLRRWLRP